MISWRRGFPNERLVFSKILRLINPNPGLLRSVSSALRRVMITCSRNHCSARACIDATSSASSSRTSPKMLIAIRSVVFESGWYAETVKSPSATSVRRLSSNPSPSTDWFGFSDSPIHACAKHSSVLGGWKYDEGNYRFSDDHERHDGGS